MHFFLLDAVAAPHGETPEQEGFAVVWVNSDRYADCQRAAIDFAHRRGFTVRSVQAAQRPTAEQMERMSLAERAARAKGFHEGVWGYFVAKQISEPASGTRLTAEPLSGRIVEGESRRTR